MDIQDYISSGVIEAYVMGLATEEEVQILECVQKNNALVRQAVSDAQETLGLLHQAQAVRPPVNLKAAIWSKIQDEEQEIVNREEGQRSEIRGEAPDENIQVLQPVYKNNSRSATYWAAAASFLLLLSVGLVSYFLSEREKMSRELSVLKQKQLETENSYAALNQKWNLSSSSGVKTVALAGVEKHPDSKAIVYLDSADNKTYLSIENMPSAPSGYQYQLWALVDGIPVDAGVIALNDEGVHEMKLVENAQAYAITLEKAGGSPVPTLENMYVIGNI